MKESGYEIAMGTTGTKTPHRRPFSTVIGCLIEVHRTLGPGLLESVYEHCLAHELALAGLPFEQQLPLPVVYKGTQLDCGYRLDIVVDKTPLCSELKAVESLLPVHEAQLMTYLKLCGLHHGFLVNFNTPGSTGLKAFSCNVSRIRQHAWFTYDSGAPAPSSPLQPFMVAFL